MEIKIRKALPEDVPTIIRLLAEDDLGLTREKFTDPLPPEYYAAFDAINNDKNSFLMIAELNDRIVGTLQLNFITYLTYRGGKRAQIEDVRVEESVRRHGIGKKMLAWAIEKSREMGCHLVQLTTDKKRIEALQFYISLGFIASHEGLKLHFNLDSQEHAE